MSSLENDIEWKITKDPVDYEQALTEMDQRAAAIRTHSARELIWLLEHPSIYTCGTSAKPDDILIPHKCPIYQTGRGGQVTYHGPGQRIAYVLLDLEKRNPDIRAYVRQLEDWVIQTLKTYQIQAYRRDNRIGLWVPRTNSIDDKIAAIGVRVKKWVSLHGLAINVHPDLSYYQGIIPCGIKEHGVTSMKELGHNIKLEDMDKILKETFYKVFK